MMKFVPFLLLLSWTIPQTQLKPTEFLWENRLIIVFAGPEAELAENQMKAFEGQEAAIKDRDLRLFSLPTGPHPWRDRYAVPEDEFTILLVGKDGGVKRRSKELVEPRSLFRQIDQMPMRRREMRDK